MNKALTAQQASRLMCVLYISMRRKCFEVLFLFSRDVCRIFLKVFLFEKIEKISDTDILRTWLLPNKVNLLNSADTVPSNPAKSETVILRTGFALRSAAVEKSVPVDSFP